MQRGRLRRLFLLIAFSRTHEAHLPYYSFAACPFAPSSFLGFIIRLYRDFVGRGQQERERVKVRSHPPVCWWPAAVRRRLSADKQCHFPISHTCVAQRLPPPPPQLDPPRTSARRSDPRTIRFFRRPCFFLERRLLCVIDWEDLSIHASIPRGSSSLSAVAAVRNPTTRSNREGKHTHILLFLA